MKIMSEWLEGIIENVDKANRSSVFLLMLIVLILGAGSLYVLLNTSA